MIYDAVQIGPFIIQYFLIIVLLTFFINYVLIQLLINNIEIKQFIKQYYITMVLMTLFTYKFGIILFQPDILFTKYWFYFTGGTKAMYLGFILSILFLIWQMFSKKLSTKVVVTGILIMFICFHILYPIIKIIVLSLT
ncbi:hypothetical protein [Metabacillus malikii]|uniref:Uncharacterized protein n=1 Tax=Metabacillus malikii TaxID=1504265 RepID=A0ABT9ZCD6_9BACI|nr:hypothetical protein [Metabacillus malikii]MDQ0229929.1 hypothetical protein [Metabacillus malikii]